MALEKGKSGRVDNAELGFYTRPVFVSETQVVKKLSGFLTKRESEELIKKHDLFIKRLRRIGINIPKTSMKAIPKGKKFFIEITQERFKSSELAGEIIKKSSRKQVLLITNSILKDSLKFLNSNLLGHIGFHPTVRNYAFRNGKAYCIDTFPPYGSKRETEAMMIKHAPSKKMKVLMSIFRPLLRVYAREYYNPVEMILGIVGTACRLRPEFEKDITRQAKGLITKANLRQGSKVLKKLNKPKKQKTMWKVAHRLYVK